jgi:hypothetical protein
MVHGGMAENDKAEVVMIDDTNVDDVNLEKAPAVRVVDDYQVLGLSQEDADFYNSWTPAMRKKLMHKVQWLSCLDPAKPLTSCRSIAV